MSAAGDLNELVQRAVGGAGRAPDVGAGAGK
jgi:hypothetical protein